MNKVKLNRSKVKGDTSKSNIDLGRLRKARIRKFRAKKEMDGQPIDTIDAAVNTLIDRGLEVENI